MILQKQHWRFPGYHAWNIFYQICFTSWVKKTGQRLHLSNFTIPFLPLDVESSFFAHPASSILRLLQLDLMRWFSDSGGTSHTETSSLLLVGDSTREVNRNELQTKVNFGVFFHKKRQLGQYSKMLWVVNRGYSLYGSDIFLTLLSRLYHRVYGKTFLWELVRKWKIYSINFWQKNPKVQKCFGGNFFSWN